jgi:hypothetical protein
VSKILKTIELTDHAIRRAVFAVLEGFAAEHRAATIARVVSWQFDPEQAQR